MKHLLQKADTTVKEMWIGIAVWGVVCELATVWLVKDRFGCALGLLIGCILAAAGVYHALAFCRRVGKKRESDSSDSLCQ